MYLTLLGGAGTEATSDRPLNAYVCSRALDKEKNVFQLSYSVCSFDAFDIADPSTRQTACHKWTS